MAVYSDVTSGDLRSFLQAYDLGPPLSFKGIAEGVENSNFFLETTRGAFIVTLYERRVREGDLPFFLGLMEYLSSHGLVCPLPVRRRDGAQWSHLSGRPATVLTFLKGLSLNTPSETHCAAVGAALAALHEAGQGFRLRRPNALGLEDWARLARESSDRADRVLPGLKTLIDDEIAALRRCWPRDLPSGIIHADLFPDNVLFAGDEVSGLIDFYFACNDAFAYDLAITINAWCFDSDGSYNIRKGNRLIAAYRERRALSAAETKALPILCRGAAMRFLLTRLYDHLHHDAAALVRPKDPAEFIARLRFHQTVRDCAQYGI